MDRLVTVREMAERYGCSNPTARKYLRQCAPHLENPLVAPEWAVNEWEQSRMVVPAGISHRKTVDVSNRMNSGRIIVPRHR